MHHSSISTLLLGLELNKPDGDHTKGELWWWLLEVLVRGSGMKLLVASTIHMYPVFKCVSWPYHVAL